MPCSLNLGACGTANNNTVFGKTPPKASPSVEQVQVIEHVPTAAKRRVRVPFLARVAGASYEYVGCYKNDNGDQRLAEFTHSKTVSWCKDASKAAGKAFFGLE